MSMFNNSVYYLFIAMAVVSGLCLSWKLLDYIHGSNRRRKVKARHDAGEANICRYGVNAAGELTRVHTRYSRKEGPNVS